MDRLPVNRFSFRRKGSHKSKEQKERDNFDYDQMTYLSQEEAQQIDAELISEYSFSYDQLVELAGQSCATAIARMYPKESLTKDNGALLVCCGPGNTGAVGLACARHLKQFGYRETIFLPIKANKPLFQNLTSQCEKMDIPFLSYFPGDAQLITDSYNLIIDAFFGFSFQGPFRGDFGMYISQLMKTGVPICSIDVPSGWDIASGDPNGIKPESLISLTAPKLCAKLFDGKQHFLCGRFIPPDLAKKYKLNLPSYPGTDYCVELLTQRPTNDKRNDAKDDEQNDVE